MKKIMCNLITPYRCKECNQDMLFFITPNNTLLDYKKIFDTYQNLQGIRNFLYTKNIRFIKCLVCNKSYIIDWTSGYPTQLMNKKDLEKFGV